MKRGNKGLSAAAFWLAVWYAVAFAVKSQLLLPYPHVVLITLFTLIPQKIFLASAGLSVARMAFGISAGIMAGALFGYLTSKSELCDAILRPFISVLRATPVASFIVLFLLWAGRNILPGIISMIVVIPIVWSNVHQGLTDMDKNILEMTRVFRISGWKKLSKVTAGYVKPYFLSSVRTAIGMGWKSGIAAEVLTMPEKSIGKHIMESKLYLETPELFAWTAFVVILSVIIEKLALMLLSGKAGGHK